MTTTRSSLRTVRGVLEARTAMAASGVAARWQATATMHTIATTIRHSVASPRPSYHQRVRGFHASSRRMEGPTKSPFQAFVDTLREELKKSQEMQDNMKQLQGEAGKVQDSETMRRMREAYEKARIVASIKENPRLQAAANRLRKSGGQVGDAVGATLKQMEESELIKGLGAVSSRLARQLEQSTAPIRNTEAYRSFAQTLTDALDDGGSALRIRTDAQADARTQRTVKRNARLRKIGKPPPSDDVEKIMMEATEMKDKLQKMESEIDPIAAARMAKEMEEQEAKAAAAAAAANAEGGTEQAEAPEPASPSSSSSAAADNSATAASAEQQASTSSAPRKPLPKPKGFAARVRVPGVADPNAGQALVLRPEPKYKQAWSSFKESNPLMRTLSDMRDSYNASENPVVERVRSITDSIGGWFGETETARVVQAFRMLDPAFSSDAITRELREYIIPELIDSYHSAARHLLRQWCGEATFNVLMATIDPYTQKGAVLTGQLLDIKALDITQWRILENDVPVLVVAFTTQELMYFRDVKTDTILAGSQDQADLCRYAIVLTRVEEEMDNEITGGWKVIELIRRGQRAFL